MIRRLGAVVACVTVAAVALPSPARAGTFTVRACHSDGVNNSWHTFRSNGYADAYIQCPGGAIINGHANEGMVARNTGGTGSAPPYSHAKVFFDAPLGARIVGVSGQILFQSTGGWAAGIHDDTGNRWLWCGSTCLSSYDRVAWFRHRRTFHRQGVCPGHLRCGRRVQPRYPARLCGTQGRPRHGGGGHSAKRRYPRRIARCGWLAQGVARRGCDGQRRSRRPEHQRAR